MSLTDKRLVLDLDKTLIYSSNDLHLIKELELHTNPKNMDLRSKIYSFTLIDSIPESFGKGEKIYMFGMYRPYLREFVNFITNYFKHIYIYSAGQFKYVHSLVDRIFEHSEIKPKIIYTIEECEKCSDGGLTKPLRKLFNNINSDGATPENTIIIDDIDKMFINDKFNGIVIPEFTTNFTANNIRFHTDVSLLQLMFWFLSEEFMSCKDVRILDKSYIFKTSIETYIKKIEHLTEIKHVEQH